jgi:hypothetical protein
MMQAAKEAARQQAIMDSLKQRETTSEFQVDSIQ